MNRPSIRLPPLNALRAFWVVMRRGSLRAAADELLVTPQAVSQQIKLLEDTLHVPLFERKGRIVEPTEHAILLSHFVQAGFEELSEGIKRVSNSTLRNRININVSPFFATHFLLARLERFREREPGVDIRLTTMIDLPDFAADEIDLTIQWGFGSWKDLDATLLVHDPKVVCCAPELAEKIQRPEDLIHQTLLHPVLARSLWSRVLRHLGVEYQAPAGEIQLHDAETMRRGTISGMGVGLISRVDAHKELKKGRLVAPLGVDALADMAEEDTPGFYLVLPRAHMRVRLVASFCQWITSERWEEPQ